MDVLVLILGLAAVTVGAELLVRGAAALALRLGLSPLFVGLTVVGFGTSSPELGASLTATLAGSAEVSVGNVVGSNIFNIAVILGLTALVQPIRIRIGAVRRDLAVAIFAAMVPWVGLAGWSGSAGTIGSRIGLALVAGLVVYLVVAFRAARRAAEAEKTIAAEQVATTLPATRRPGRLVVPGNAALVVAGLTLLVLGSRLFIGSALDLARGAGIPELVLGLTLVAAGTSLPELVTSLVAARRGNPDIAVGNVIGSNIFNSFGILGVCAMAGPQTVARQVLVLDTPLLLLATLALIPIMRSGGRISRVEGGVLLAGYAAYLTTLVVLTR